MELRLKSIFDANEKAYASKTPTAKTQAKRKASNDAAVEAENKVKRLKNASIQAKEEGDEAKIKEATVLLAAAKDTVAIAYKQSRNGKANARYSKNRDFDRRSIFCGLDKAIANLTEHVPNEKDAEIGRILQGWTNHEDLLAQLKGLKM